MSRLFIVLLLLIPAAIARAAETPRKLNVVFILADDLGWGELGCYGQEKIPTPHLDRLAKEGTRFTRFYSGAPVCAPSRCVLMTGKHLGHAEVRGNQQAKVIDPQFTEGQTPLSPEAVTFPMLFQKAGYATGAMGKWGLGPVGSTGEPNRKGFDLFLRLQLPGRRPQLLPGIALAEPRKGRDQYPSHPGTSQAARRGSPSRSLPGTELRAAADDRRGREIHR